MDERKWGLWMRMITRGYDGGLRTSNLVRIFIFCYHLCVILQDGRTALHLAADEGHMDTVDILCDFNASSNAETIVRTLFEFVAFCDFVFPLRWILHRRCVKIFKFSSKS